MGMLKRLSLTPSSRVPSRSTTPIPPDPIANPITVILTGSTGNFGAYLLDVLLADTTVKRIYCLNRSADAAARQPNAQRTRGLSASWAPDRVHFLQADLTHERLGLSETTYATLASEADLIIHNAWPVDFNRNFASFKPSVNGVNALISFALSSAPASPPAAILFISSISAAANWSSHAPTSRAFIPEVELTEWKLSRTGYGQSKLLSERLLAHAARTLGLRIAIARVGQLAGPVTHGTHGAWPEREWAPALIRSSAALGALPASLGPVEDIAWVPADVAARVVGELAAHTVAQPPAAPDAKRHPEPSFFHVVNPRRTAWAALVPSVLAHLPRGTRAVPFAEWVDMLKASAEPGGHAGGAGGGFAGVDSGANPAAKLIDYFDNLQDRAVRFPRARAAELECRRTVAVSRTLEGCGAVGGAWMELWMRQWGWGFADRGPPVPPKD